MTNRPVAAWVVLCASFLLWNCGGGSAPSPGPTPIPGGGGSTPSTPATVQIVAAGDSGQGGFGALKTGQLLDSMPGTLLALGDLAYMQGSAADFRDCYEPAWGRHLDRTRPVPGNHEYVTAGAASFFDFFGGLAGPRGQGYYAFPAGSWRIIALNSEVPKTPGTAQNQWLRSELETNRAACTLAFWHRPLFSSGQNGNNDDTRELWRLLEEFGVDVVLNGHDHMYERFAPQDMDGKAKATGIRQFIVGTGGASLYPVGGARPNSEVRASVYGILAMSLSPTSYQWDFKSVDSGFHDSGTGACH
jgi:acid phosphatase type 7